MIHASNILSYASPRQSLDHASQFDCPTVALVAIIGFILTFGCTISSFHCLVSTYSGCATGRGAAAFSLTFYPPVFMIIPGLAAFLARSLPCRCALWASLASWLTAMALIEMYPMFL
jgi:hypothetical protein